MDTLRMTRPLFIFAIGLDKGVSLKADVTSAPDVPSLSPPVLPNYCLDAKQKRLTEC